MYDKPSVSHKHNEVPMKQLIRIAAVLLVVSFATMALFARPTHSEPALWIKISEHGKVKTTIAVTEPIARMIAESDKQNVHFHAGNKERDLITRQMLESVLDGRESSVTAKDAENDTEAEVYMKRLKVPGSQKDNNHLIMETFKDGEQSFRMKLGEFSFESKDDETGDVSETGFSWKSLLPFLSKTGGGIYIHDHTDDSEIWVYVE
jgi:hypothetical protein